ncbi:MAG: NUMOD3 domain-containing DNA-binding protein [Bacilli bacterium]|nr:NUMOD3 domain-containing DNA-binding protein [Bacilli bacterium]MDD4123793.1 NUMOD3 domain-containing DNA-binding protein [Bacilli bacterium]
MIITKEVKKIINNKNIDWYKNKGYDCNLKDEIVVNVEDLMRGSQNKIECKCDNCGKTTFRPFADIVSKQSIYDKTYCSSCAASVKLTHHDYLAKDGFKLCRKCNRKLPANSDYFYLKNDTKDGFISMCKECMDHEFTDKLTRIPKDGYKFCNKCGRELPNTSKYFPVTKQNKSGLLGICRECNPNYHNFLKDDYIHAQIWSEEENSQLIKTYNNYTGKELQNLFFPNRTVRAIECHASELGIQGKNENVKNKTKEIRRIRASEANAGKIYSEETKQKISNAKIEYYKTHDGTRKGSIQSEETRKKMSDYRKKIGKWKGKNNPRHLKPLNGKLNGRWLGGITGLYQELRSDTKEWQQNSMQYYNYKCVISNGEFDNVHHLTPFKNIVKECFDICDIDMRQSVCDYSILEFKLIRNTLIKLHNKYEFGVPLNKSIHKLFHDNYGYFNNTPEQFHKFVLDINDGKFNKWFKDNNLNIEINNEILNQALLEKSESAS